MDKELLGFDYETYLIGNIDEETNVQQIIPKPVCISYCDENRNTGIVIGMDNMESWLKRTLSNLNIIKVAHNCTFELLVTYEYFPKLRPLIWENLEKELFFCTQLQQRLLDNISEKELRSHSLANLVDHYYKIDLSDVKTNPDAWRLRYSELDNVPLRDWPKEAIDYAINDSIYTLDVMKKQLNINNNLIQIEHLKASTTLNLMAARGIKISRDRVETLEKEINDQLYPAYDKLIKAGFMSYNEKKDKYSKKIKLLKEHVSANFKNLKLTKTKAVSTSGEALEAYLIENPEDEILQMFKFIGQYEKIKSAFLSRLKTANPYIYTSYNPIVRSGRTSSRATDFYPSVNIQQQPRGIT